MNFVRFGSLLLPTEIAVTEKEQALGLMFRNDVERAMSFIYTEAKPNAFWMKNTYIPLDIIFCREGKVVEVAHGKPLSEKTVGHDVLSDLVVELPYGTAAKLGIEAGTEVELVCDTQALHRKIALKYQLD